MPGTSPGMTLFSEKTRAATALEHALIPQRGVGARRSISRVLSRPSGEPSGARMAIHLGRPSPDASRDRPERRRERPARRSRQKPRPPAAPTWSCSRWGLPCRRRCRRRGALLPHHFTLAAHAVPKDCRARRCVSVALSLRSPPPGVTRHRASVEPGLSSPGPGKPRAKRGHPTVWHGIKWDRNTEVSKPI